jgi:hypothetical protein
MLLLAEFSYPPYEVHMAHQTTMHIEVGNLLELDQQENIILSLGRESDKSYKGLSRMEEQAMSFNRSFSKSLSKFYCSSNMS